MSPEQVKELNDALAHELVKLTLARMGIAVAVHFAVKGFVWFLARKH